MASVDLDTSTLTLTPTAAVGVAITINGELVNSGSAWTSALLTLGINTITIVVNAGGQSTTYTLIVTRESWTPAQEAYIKASNTGRADYFGRSIAMSGDTLVVGAINEDSRDTGVNGDQDNEQAVNSGAAYVFVRSGDTWSQHAYLKASNADSTENFGYSVAVSGDTVVVSAIFDDCNAVGVNSYQDNVRAPGSGAVYVFVRDGSTWTQQAYVKSSNTELGDNFGSSVAISGDTLVVGAHEEDSSAKGIDGDQSDNHAEGSGAVYVFVRHGTSWRQQAYLKASNTESGDYFGGSVAISGDTLAVGATGESSSDSRIDGNQDDNNALESGAAYVFTRSGSVWSQQAYIKANNTEAGDLFGFHTALADDTLVVAAPQELDHVTGVNDDLPITADGAVYIFARRGATWSQQAYLKINNSEPGRFLRWFGSSVAVAGNTIAVGVPQELVGGAHVYTRSGSAWTQHAHLAASNAHPNDCFGSSVAVSGDTIAVGAPCESSNATGVNGDETDDTYGDSGAVYVFR
jgi:hypothetical protein